MKKIFTLLAVVLMTANVLAQAPQTMGYQAVIRNSANALVTTQVGMKISILQATSTGTAVYVETQTPTPNANGLVSLAIGSGTVVSGTFAGIDWSAGPYFIKTETDPAGGTSYSISGTSQLLSVPYALNAGSITNANGLVLPKMTTTQRDAISAPSLGTLIYNTTTNGMQLYGYLSAASSLNVINSIGSGNDNAVPINSGIGQSFKVTNAYSVNSFILQVTSNAPVNGVPSPLNATGGNLTLSFYSGTPGSGTLLGSKSLTIISNAGTFNFGITTPIIIPAGLAYWEIKTDSTSSFSVFRASSNYNDAITETAYSFNASDVPTSISTSLFPFSFAYTSTSPFPLWINK